MPGDKIMNIGESNDFVLRILRHNFVEESNEFDKTPHICELCYGDELLGEHFARLDGCKHAFCLECLKFMCKMHVQNGTIRLLKCPQAECKEGGVVSIQLMAQLLSPDEFKR